MLEDHNNNNNNTISKQTPFVEVSPAWVYMVSISIEPDRKSILIYKDWNKAVDVYFKFVEKRKLMSIDGDGWAFSKPGAPYGRACIGSHKLL